MIRYSLAMAFSRIWNVNDAIALTLQEVSRVRNEQKLLDREIRVMVACASSQDNDLSIIRRSLEHHGHLVWAVYPEDWRNAMMHMPDADQMRELINDSDEVVIALHRRSAADDWLRELCMRVARYKRKYSKYWISPNGSVYFAKS